MQYPGRVLQRSSVSVGGFLSWGRGTREGATHSLRGWCSGGPAPGAAPEAASEQPGAPWQWGQARKVPGNELRPPLLWRGPTLACTARTPLPPDPARAVALHTCGLPGPSCLAEADPAGVPVSQWEVQGVVSQREWHLRCIRRGHCSEARASARSQGKGTGGHRCVH